MRATTQTPVPDISRLPKSYRKYIESLQGRVSQLEREWPEQAQTLVSAQASHALRPVFLPDTVTVRFCSAEKTRDDRWYDVERKPHDHIAGAVGLRIRSAHPLIVVPQVSNVVELFMQWDVERER